MDRIWIDVQSVKSNPRTPLGATYQNLDKAPQKIGIEK